MNEYERGFRDAIEAATAVAKERRTYGYVADVGCFSCFARIAEAISKLQPKSRDHTE